MAPSFATGDCHRFDFIRLKESGRVLIPFRDSETDDDENAFADAQTPTTATNNACVFDIGCWGVGFSVATEIKKRIFLSILVLKNKKLMEHG